jgi:hypothetical protein
MPASAFRGIRHVPAAVSGNKNCRERLPGTLPSIARCMLRMALLQPPEQFGTCSAVAFDTKLVLLPVGKAGRRHWTKKPPLQIDLRWGGHSGPEQIRHSGNGRKYGRNEYAIRCGEANQHIISVV